jgi:hypothetical protein
MPLDDDEPLTMVRVINSTAERDGSRREFFLRVPHDMRTARASVAWSFGLKPMAYAPVQET